MSEAASAAPAERAANAIRELRVSGRLMTFEPGLFCILHKPGPNVDPATAMPGVRISLPPGPVGRPDAVSIKTFRDDGFLYGYGDAALVRVIGGPAQVLVTIYQLPDTQGPGPNIEVQMLVDGRQSLQRQVPAPAGAATQVAVDMIAHVQGRGDVGAKFGEWLGDKGSKRWIEGFAVSPSKDIAPTDIEYQAVLGRGWLSPWAEGGQFCGSRGMALPLLGLKVRLRGAAAEAWDCACSATFIDGSAAGPIAAGEACESEALAPMESFRIEVFPRGEGPSRASDDARRRAAAAAAKPPGAKPPPPKPKVTPVHSPAVPPRRRP